MTDKQLLLSIRGRAAQRLGNFTFIKIVDELLTQCDMVSKIEKNILDRLVTLCTAFGVRLDVDDIECVDSRRPSTLVDTNRISRLREAGMHI